jgi:2-C-methyl-D-erythritol 4-phosphate cytidylyltransferase
LELIEDKIDLIAVHDAVRCCVTKEWIEKVISTAAQTGAAILACPITATIKQAKDNTIIKTIDRTGLYEAQTPQVFEAKLLKKAYENLKNLDISHKDTKAQRKKIYREKPSCLGAFVAENEPKSKISDDAQLVEALGHKVSIVETDFSNIKITRQSDVAIVEAIIKSRPKPKPKGYVGPYGEAEW